jgi:aryl-phospho-beta-D-glucosidase BglC (GH1 family)/20S proteasome alpha/beta subunit
MSGFSLFGVNLSGAEYDPGGTLEGTNYTYPTDAEIDYYASKGMTVIRLPFLLERVEPVAGGPLNTTELGYIDNVVNYAASKGIDVILDPHDYGDEYGTVIGTTAASNATFANFWGELAAHFASTPNVLFGLMNEPNAVTPTQWLASANAAIAAIRAAGATTQQILVPGTDWDGADTWVSSGNAQVLGSGIVDPSHNFAFEVHQYLDADGSGTSSTVVSTAIGVERLTAITQWAEATGNKLFLGEFGVASDPTSLTALNNMLGYMAQHTDVWEGGTYWAAGPWLGNYMYSVEPTNGVDAPQMGVLDQYVTKTIESAGSTSLIEFGTNFYFDNISSGAAVEFKYSGTPVTANEFAGWSFTAAEQTSTGYEVALHLANTDQYTVWDTDSNGNVVSNATGGIVSGSSSALESLEPSFQQDLNGDGAIGVPTTVIVSSTSINLVEAGSNFYLDSITSGSGPEFKYGGAPIVPNEFGAWTFIGVEQTTSGYEIALHLPGTNQYTVWDTDGNGNVVSNATGGIVSGTSNALESLEASFHQDLNGDGVIGIPTTVIESSGSTSLVEVGTNFYLESISSGTGPELKYGGTPVVANEFGAWTFVGAEQTSSGYEVALSLPGADQYTVWDTESNGNVVSNATGGVVSGTSNALESLEASFHQDLNGDGVIGVPTTVIESSGSTSLVQAGTNFYLDSISNGTGPELKYGGATVVANEFGAWTFIAAEQTFSGYEVALSLPGENQYTVWDTDSNGNVVSNATGGIVSGTSNALESLEASFHQDLNGDGVTGLAVAANATLELTGANSQNVSFESSTGTLRLDNPTTFSGQVVGFTGDGTWAGSDRVDLLNFAFSSAIQTDTTYNASTGALSVSNGISVDLLDFVGSYSLANFKFASDGQGGTIVYDPPVTSPSSTEGADGSTVVIGNSTIQGNEGLQSPVIVASGATLTFDHAVGGGTITNNGTVDVTSNSTVNLVAGAGPDNFVFAPNFGQATIKNFTPGTDSLQIDHTMFVSLNALTAAMHDDTHGNAVITDAAHDTITIENITTAQLFAHQGDFHIV